MACPFCGSEKTHEVKIAYREAFSKYGVPLINVRFCEKCGRLFGDKY